MRRAEIGAAEEVQAAQWCDGGRRASGVLRLLAVATAAAYCPLAARCSDDERCDNKGVLRDPVRTDRFRVLIDRSNGLGASELLHRTRICPGWDGTFASFDHYYGQGAARWMYRYAVHEGPVLYHGGVSGSLWKV